MEVDVGAVTEGGVGMVTSSAWGGDVTTESKEEEEEGIEVIIELGTTATIESSITLEVVPIVE